MIIKSISISNFLCYYGENNLFKFSEGLNIVLGANGYGKSKLYDAFQWVFTNQITDNDTNNKAGFKPTPILKKQIVSEKALSECHVGSSVECKVIIEAQHTSGKIYQLIRSYTVAKKDEGVWLEPKDSKFSVYAQDILNYKPLAESEHSTILERLLPVEVRPYVWFQGERGINSLIDTSSDESLKNVIKRLSDIDRWDKYISISKKAFDSAQNAFDQELRKSKKHQDKINDLQAKQKDLINKLAQLDNVIIETQKNLKAAQQKNEELSVNLENAQVLNTLSGEEENLSKEIKSIEEEIDRISQGINKKLFTNYWVLMHSESLIDKFEDLYQTYTYKGAEKKAQEELRSKVEEKLQGRSKSEVRLPGGVPEPMHVNTMLKLQECLVCKRPAPQGSDAYKAIESLLPKAEPPKQKPKPSLDSLFKKIYHNSLSLKGNIISAEEDIKETFTRISELTVSKKDVESKLETVSNDIQEQLRKSGLTNPKHIIDSVRITAADIRKYSMDLGSYEKDKEGKEKELRGVNAELSNISKGEVAPHLTIKKDLLEDFAALTKRVKHKKYKELVKLLEDQANEHYKNINAPTGAFYGKLKFIESIDGGYKPSIIDPDSKADVTASVNTSLINSMKLSIIMAVVTANKIRNYANFYPLIADAPLSDFDTVKVKSFLKETAASFSQSIIIIKEMLVKDEKRKDRYKPDSTVLRELKDEIDSINKKLVTYQIDIPDEVANKNRDEIQIEIKEIIK